MRKQSTGSLVAVAVAAAAIGASAMFSVTKLSGQATRPARVGGKPNFSGIWQANNEANYDLQAHGALPAQITQPGIYPFDYTRVPAAAVVALGATGAIPPSLGVVQGDGQIPYKPEAVTQRDANRAGWPKR